MLGRRGIRTYINVSHMRREKVRLDPHISRLGAEGSASRANRESLGGHDDGQIDTERPNRASPFLTFVLFASFVVMPSAAHVSARRPTRTSLNDYHEAPEEHEGIKK